MESDEKVVFSNSLGTLTNKRVIFNFKGGNEDIPIKQITSVSYERKQNIIMAVIYFAVCLIILVSVFNMHDVQGSIIVVAMIAVIFCILVGIANYIGNYFIRISVAGNDRPLMKIEMAKTKDGRELTDAIRKQIIAN